MVLKVIDAVSDVANAIRSYLHFSVPDVGSLTDYESWTPDLMFGLAKGIEQSKGMVQKAVSGVVADIVINPRLSAMEYSQKQTDSLDSIRQMFSGMQNAGGSKTICIPVYVGGTPLDEVVVYAQARQNLRSGGR